MRARLTLETGDCLPSAIDLSPHHPATLGRSRDNAIVLRDDLASRLHAKVYCEDGRWYVRDFGLNGTRVGGLRVSGAAELTDGATVQIGETKLRFAVLGVTPPPMQAMQPIDSPAVTAGIRGPGSGGRIKAAGSDVLSADKLRSKSSDSFGGTKPHQFVERVPPAPLRATDDSAVELKNDELTALTRYMTTAVDCADPHELIRITLRAVLHQTAAKIAGYLGLDPTDPTPKLVLPESAPVDTSLSRRLTERVRTEKKTVWLNAPGSRPPGDDGPPTQSLSAFTDALCLPLAAGGEAFAALHVYRTGVGFAERDVRFIEAVAGYLAKGLETHRHRRKLEAENNRLRASVPTADELIGDSSAMMTLRSQIGRAAPQPFTVLITGESGSGKELVAQALHRHSSRTGGPLVVVNCASIAPSLLEAELFGYRKGAFSGADHDHPGLFEQADDGTLFLDEVGELTPECQAKLLRVIEGKPFRPVGGTSEVKVDVRVIAATHRDLEHDTRTGRFRQDLLFRLRVILLRVPPLRDHPEDVPELARFFVQRLSQMCHRPLKLTPLAVKKLQAYPWPGNVRQLRAVLESAAVMCETDAIDAADLPLGAVAADAAPAADLPPSLDMDELETWAIRRALRQTAGNVSRAALVLGMSRDTLHTKLKKKGIDREEMAAAAAAAD